MLRCIGINFNFHDQGYVQLEGHRIHSQSTSFLEQGFNKHIDGNNVDAFESTVSSFCIFLS